MGGKAFGSNELRIVNGLQEELDHRQPSSPGRPPQIHREIEADVLADGATQHQPEIQDAAGDVGSLSQAGLSSCFDPSVW
jgi:hypothetical protein